MEYKDKNEVQAIIEARLNRNKKILEKWELVKKCHKKDGTEYKRLQDAYKGAFFTNKGSYYEIVVICPINERIYHSRITINNADMTAEKIEKEVQEIKNRLKAQIQKDENELNTLNNRIEDLNNLIAPLKAYLKDLVGTVENLRLYEEYTQYYLNK